MINESTKIKLMKIGVSEFIDSLENQEKTLTDLSLTFDERFTLLVDDVYQNKYNSTVQRFIKSAKFRYPEADIADVIYKNGRGISKELIQELASCNYIHSHKSLVLKGPTGTGKSWLACALGKQACKLEYKTLYIRMPDLFEKYKENQIYTKSKEKFINKLSKYTVLVIDEWLLYKLTNAEALLLLEILERRYDSKTTIFCTQFEISEWYERLGDSISADAIMDRIVHNMINITMGTTNMRDKS